MTDEKLLGEIAKLVSKVSDWGSAETAFRVIVLIKQAGYVKLVPELEREIDYIIRLWLPGQSYGYNEATGAIWKLLTQGKPQEANFKRVE